MSHDKTRLFFALPGRGDPEDPEQGRAVGDSAPEASPEQEQTRFLPVELLLEQQRRESSQHEAGRAPATQAGAVDDGSSDAQAAPGELGETTDLRRAFASATLLGRARRAWQALSIVSRISVVLAVLVVLPIVLPRAVPAALESGAALTRTALARAARPTGARKPPAAPEAPRELDAPSADAPAHPAPLPLAAGKVSPRAAADAVAQGRCADAVALYLELSRRHPEVEAYREAARLLKQQYAGCTESE